MDAGLTQAQLADLLGLSQQTIQKYEQGGVQFTVERLREIAKTLNCDASSLSTISNHQAPKKLPARSRPLTEFELSVLAELSKIADLSKKRLALQMIRVIAEAKQGKET